jgi:anthranilate 1,2-dioxygenase large subunit
MLSAASTTIDVSPGQFQWPPVGVTRAPYRLFADRDIYQLEQKRTFRGRSWNFLALDVEIPDVGDCKTTSVAETPVIVTRDKEGNIDALVNRARPFTTPCT